MHGLKIPTIDARARVERDDGVLVRIGRRTLTAEKNVGLGAREHRVQQRAIDVDSQRERRMQQGRAAAECPPLFATACVIGAHAAGRAVRADDQQILEARRRGVVRRRHQQLSATAELGHFLPRRRVERDERASDRKKDARGGRCVARPKTQAPPRRRALLEREAPNFVTAITAQRHDAIGRGRVQHPVNDERRQLRAFERRAVGGAERVRPRLPQLVHVGRRDLPERREARACQIAVVARPIRAAHEVDGRGSACNLRQLRRRLVAGGQHDCRQRCELPHSVAPGKLGVGLRQCRREGT